MDSRIQRFCFLGCQHDEFGEYQSLERWSIKSVLATNFPAKKFSGYNFQNLYPGAYHAWVSISADATGVYFWYQNRGFEAEIATLAGEKAEVDKELAVMKSTDLAKEVDSLRSQLKSKDETLIAERQTFGEKFFVLLA